MNEIAEHVRRGYRTALRDVPTPFVLAKIRAKRTYVDFLVDRRLAQRRMSPWARLVDRVRGTTRRSTHSDITAKLAFGARERNARDRLVAEAATRVRRRRK